MRAAHARRGAWPEGWREAAFSETEYLLYLTEEEARQVREQLARRCREVLRAYSARADHPERRPAGAAPVEVLLLTYPLAHLAGPPPPQPGAPPPQPGPPPPQPGAPSSRDAS